MSVPTMNKTTTKTTAFRAGRTYLPKKCADDLRAFDTSCIKYRLETSIQPQGVKTLISNNEKNSSPYCQYQNEKTGKDFNNQSYVMTPKTSPSEYNHPSSERYSSPRRDDYCYDSRCNTMVEYGTNAAKVNFSRNTLLNGKFSNSSPSVFYSPTSTQNNNNNNTQHNNNIILGQYKSKCYRGNKIKEKKSKGQVSVSFEIERRLYGLMERFMARISLFYVPATPIKFINGNQFDRLNNCIWEMYAANAQKEITYTRKLQFWKQIYLSIQNIIARYGLFLVGSTMTGLGLDSSDIDMCLLVRPGMGDPRTDGLIHLQRICNLLKSNDFVKSPEVIMAKVPILKFRDATYGFEVDLNCNNSVGIRNTHLLNAYAQLDWRVRPMVVMVKLWAQANDINDAKRMTINSYSLALMTIHYLQYGVHPPVIPCLQALYPQRFGPEIDIQWLDLQGDLPEFYSVNETFLGQLFLGFLHYFSNFNYAKFAMSVREGGLIVKEECRYVNAPKNDANQWKLLCIEEPFDLTNTARCVYDLATFEHIKNVFRVSYDTLVQTQELASILPCSALPVHSLAAPMPVLNQKN